ncbi:MAG: hypothetical protein AMXMBFR58_38130 [Phycisphaerae bacterium]
MSRPRTTLAEARELDAALSEERSVEYELSAVERLESVAGDWLLISSARPDHSRALAVARVLYATRVAFELDEHLLSRWGDQASEFLRGRRSDSTTSLAIGDFRMSVEEELRLLLEAVGSTLRETTEARDVAECVLVCLSVHTSSIRDAVASAGVDVLSQQSEGAAIAAAAESLQQDGGSADSASRVLTAVLAALGFNLPEPKPA